MKDIFILEHFDFSNEQMTRLQSLGNVKYFEKATGKEIDEAISSGGVILLDWIDPTDILTKMKKNSFICLPYTGYEWIKTLKVATSNGVIISNTPNYSTNAVAEHHLSLMLSVAKHILYFNEFLKKQEKVPFNRSVEINEKTIGIIGLGHIGRRLAELLKPFGVKILTYNRNLKNADGIKDVDLKTLLSQSDFVCICCQLNKETMNMIGAEEMELMKPSAILTATTGGIINLKALNEHLKKDKLFGVGLDDVDQQELPQELIDNPKVTCTYHRAFDTNESEKKRIDLCIDNIEAYIKGKPINIIEKQ